MRDPFDFEKALRADGRINITMRTLRLMAALSERSGYASMSVENMASALNAKPAAVRQARQKVVALGYFHKPRGWKYRRHKLGEDETKMAFWERMQRDAHLDPTARCAFLLCDLTRKHDAITISLAELADKLNVKYDLSRAVKRILALEKHFIRKIDGGRYSYQRTWGIYDGSKPEAETADAPDPDDEAIFARWSRRTGRQRAGTHPA